MVASLVVVAALMPAVALLVHDRIAPSVAEAPLTFQIDINSADAPQLALLPGVGPALATRIIDDRTRRGDFDTVADLLRVKGIGRSISQGVAPFVRVAHATQ